MKNNQTYNNINAVEQIPVLTKEQVLEPSQEARHLRSECYTLLERIDPGSPARRYIEKSFLDMDPAAPQSCVRNAKGNLETILYWAEAYGISI